MKKWWIMVATVMAAVVILAVCIYGLPFEPPVISPSGTTGALLGTGNSQSGTTQPPETTEETLPWEPLGGSNLYITNFEFRNDPELQYALQYTVRRQVLPETLDNPDGLPVLKWVCVESAGDRVWNEAAAVEFNQMLADRNLPYRVQFTLLIPSRILSSWDDWHTHPDIQKELADADLIYGFYETDIMEELLLPITDHIYGDEQPSLSGALPDPLCWFYYEANGEIYGIPNYSPIAASQGWNVDAEFMEKCGLTVEDFNREFWEMDELFAKIYEKNGNEPFLKDGYSQSFGGVILADGVKTSLPMSDAFDSTAQQRICMCFAIDLQAEKPTIVNMLETEAFTKVQAAALRYMKAGYLEDLYVTGPNGEIRNNLEYDISYDGYIYASEPYMDESDGYYKIPCTPLRLQSFQYAEMTGISAKTTHQEESLSLLEQIIIDDALRLQLCYGKEGRDYTLKEGNVYTLITQEDGSCYYMDFLSPQAKFFDYTSEVWDYRMHSTSDVPIAKVEGMSRLERYQAHIEQATYSQCPAVFDFSVIDTELWAVESVLKVYYPMFVDTEHYSEEYYQEMLEKMEEAGLSTIIAELQRQLDAWIAEHPDWDPFSREG